MATYRCDVCDYMFDEELEGMELDDMPEDWVCPICGAAKTYFEFVDEE